MNREPRAAGAVLVGIVALVLMNRTSAQDDARGPVVASRPTSTPSGSNRSGAAQNSTKGSPAASKAMGSLEFRPTPEAAVGWRGDGTGRFPDATPPSSWSRNEAGQTQNVVWMTRLPTGSAGSPLVVGDKVLVTCDWSKLVCIDRVSGRILWMRNETIYDTLTPADKATVKATIEPLVADLKAINDAFVKDANAEVSKTGASAAKRKDFGELCKKTKEIEKKIDTAIAEALPAKYGRPKGHPYPQQWGCSTPMPCSDGKKIYVRYTTGLAACYDMDGALQWTRYQFGDSLEHGEHCSPVLADGKFIFTWMESKSVSAVYALDAANGQELWQQKPLAKAHYSVPTVLTVDNQRVLVMGTGQVLRLSDGKVLSDKKLMVNPLSTAVFDNNVYFNYNVDAKTKGGFVSAQLTAENGNVGVKVLFEKNIFEADHDKTSDPAGWKYSFCASPLFHDGLLYHITEGGVLIVHDAKDGNLLYEKDLKMDPRIGYVTLPGVCSCPTLAGKYIYLFGDKGLTVVIEPGRQYKEVARNRLEEPLDGVNNNATVATPWFAGNQVFWRSQEYLYCIGEK